MVSLKLWSIYVQVHAIAAFNFQSQTFSRTWQWNVVHLWVGLVVTVFQGLTSHLVVQIGDSLSIPPHVGMVAVVCVTTRWSRRNLLR